MPILRVTRSMITVAPEYQTANYRDCDGFMKVKLFDVLVINTNDGREYYLSNAEMKATDEGPRPVARYYPEQLIEKILRRGYVDLGYWIENEYAALTLEEKFGFNLEMEDIDRIMYH